MDFIEKNGGGYFFRKQILIGTDGGESVGLVFVEQLDAEMAQAGGDELGEEARAGLSATVEKGVAAADIRLEAMQLADAVAQVDGVFFARATAVLVSRAGAEEDAEHAVLHMKHGHVLVEGELQPLGWGFREEVEDLRDVQIVGNSEAVEAGGFAEEFRGEGVGDVEGKITDLQQVATVFVVIERGEVAKQESVGFGSLDEFQVTGLAGLEDARGGEDDF